ncbi:MAG TPA: hypothetical protein VFJ95_04825 [Gammaproteobacteria bacterium]|nr:hypothetical protein [Gammaproteobacteria bacterium]
MFGVVITVAYLAIFAGGRANDVYEGRRGKQVRVVLTSEPAIEETEILLGGTISFLFLYDRGARTVSIHPYENVLTVESDVPREAATQTKARPPAPP